MITNSTSGLQTAKEFARVVSCRRCAGGGVRGVLRDDSGNLPQPGYLGGNYWNRRVLLVGQNPGESRDRFVEQDRRYMAALAAVADEPSGTSMETVSRILEEIIPTWPVHGNYFPLEAAGLELRDIAYLNLVRCRTVGNAAPSSNVTTNCTDEHFRRWIAWLQPGIVVFIGKWAADRAGTTISAQGIPHVFMNRMRSLSGVERRANVTAVVAAVHAAVAGADCGVGSAVRGARDA